MTTEGTIDKERSLLLQTAQLRCTERQTKVLARRNEQLEALVKLYTVTDNPTQMNATPITILNVGLDNARIIDNKGESIIIEPGKTRTLDPRPRNMVAVPKLYSGTVAEVSQPCKNA
jgi:hypothetical protein